MRLGFHYHIPFHRINSGEVMVTGALGRFLDSLAVNVDQLICFMHSASPLEIPFSDHLLQATNLRWVNIGPHYSVPKRMLCVQRYKRIMRSERLNLDAMLIRGPSPLLPTIGSAVSDLPRVLLLVGDYLSGIDDLPQVRWRKETIRLWAYWNYYRQLAVAKRSLTLVNSRELYHKYETRVPNLVETRTTTLNVGDFYERDDTCQSTPIRLLYTGRIDRAKGLFELVEMVDILVKQGYDVILDLVGRHQIGDTIVEELLSEVQRRGLGRRVHYHGFKSIGAELFAFYREADIYMIASQSSEGFPRTIWEAMAHSLPIVATRVGSIPHFLEDHKHAILVSPRRPEQLTTAILHLLHNPDLRKSLIRNARTLVSSNTLESLSQSYVAHIQHWIDDCAEMQGDHIS